MRPPVLLPIRRKVCCWFWLPLKIHRRGRVWTRDLWGLVASTLTTTPRRRFISSYAYISVVSSADVLSFKGFNLSLNPCIFVLCKAFSCCESNLNRTITRYFIILHTRYDRKQEFSTFFHRRALLVLLFLSEHRHKIYTRTSTVHKYFREHCPIWEEHHVENPWIKQK
jgi:hypothetical protein